MFSLLYWAFGSLADKKAFPLDIEWFARQSSRLWTFFKKDGGGSRRQHRSKVLQKQRCIRAYVRIWTYLLRSAVLSQIVWDSQTSSIVRCVIESLIEFAWQPVTFVPKHHARSTFHLSSHSNRFSFTADKLHTYLLTVSQCFKLRFNHVQRFRTNFGIESWPPAGG